MHDAEARPCRVRPGAAEWGAVGVGAVAIVVLAVVGLLHVVHAGESLPGVTVEGADVGGLSRLDVTDRLRTTLGGQPSVHPIVLTLAGESYRITPKQAGYDVDLAGSVTKVMQAGRTGNPFAQGWADLAAWWKTRAVHLDDSVSPAALRRRLAAIAQAVDDQPDNGGISVDAGTAAVTTRLPRPGVSVDQAAALALVLRDFGPGGAGTVGLPARTLPPTTTAAQVEQVANRARAVLAAPIVLRSDAGPSISLEPTQLAALLGSKVSENSVVLTVDQKKLAALIADLSAPLEVAARSATLDVSGAPPVIDTKGDLSFTSQPASVAVTAPSRDGRTVDEKAAAAEVTRLVGTGLHTGQLVVKAQAPAVSTADAHGVTQLISTFTTHYRCCQNRVTNIQRMAQIVDGTLIAPGEEFSLNGVAGKRTTARGFLKDGEIFNHKLVDVVGGGVSQFSTTTFNAAFFAGLPIGEHKAHSFYISRYPPGRESTLDYRTIDLTWTNDTAHPILVKASYTATTVTVSLYGDDGGRTVRAATNSRESTGDGGFRISVSQVVSGPADGHRRTFVTRYLPAPAGH